MCLHVDIFPLLTYTDRWCYSDLKNMVILFIIHSQSQEVTVTVCLSFTLFMFRTYGTGKEDMTCVGKHS